MPELKVVLGRGNIKGRDGWRRMVLLCKHKGMKEVDFNEVRSNKGVRVNGRRNSQTC